MSDSLRKDDVAGDIVHVYDGIEEADNELPLWWVFVLIGAFLFSVSYWFVFHEYNAFVLPNEAYALAVQERAARSGTADPGTLIAGSRDPATLAAAQAVFATNCVACHGPNGQGVIGPNLTDDHWVHGGSALAIYTTIKDGVQAKGMPSWGPILGEKTVQQLASYIVTLRGKNAVGKAPEGEVWAGNEDEPAK